MYILGECRASAISRNAGNLAAILAAILHETTGAVKVADKEKLIKAIIRLLRDAEPGMLEMIYYMLLRR